MSKLYRQDEGIAVINKKQNIFKELTPRKFLDLRYADNFNSLIREIDNNVVKYVIGSKFHY